MTMLARVSRVLILLAPAGLLACGDDLGPRVPAAIVVTPETPRVPLAGTLQLDASVVDASGREIPGQDLTFSSSAESVVSVDEAGVLTSAGSPGSSLITVASGEISAELEAVVALPPSALIVGTRSLTLNLGVQTSVYVTLTDENGEPVPNAAIAFEGSNPAVVQVVRYDIFPDSVFLTGLERGTTTVTVSSGGSTAEIQITVIRLPVAVVVTPQSLVLSSGESQQVAAAVVDYLGQDIDVLEPIVWSSSDEAVATVSPTGLVTSVGPEGSAIITATMDTLTVSLGAFVGTPPAGERLATVPFDEFPRGVTVTSTGRFFIAGYGGFASGTLPTLAFSKQAALLGPGEDVVLNGSVTRAYLVGTTVELNGRHPTGVVVMDLAANSPIDFLPVGLGRPSSGALSGDGTVLTVGTDHGFERIDLAARKSLGGTAAGHISKITHHPLKPLLYASGGVGVLELDPKTGEIKRWWRGGVASHAVTSDGSKLYTVDFFGAPINVIDLETGERVQLPGRFAGGDVVLSPDDRFLYVSLPSNHSVDGSKVFIVDPFSGALLRTIVLGGLSQRIAMSSDGIAIVTNDGVPGTPGWVDFVR
jgi:uncharacterized protein YjdB